MLALLLLAFVPLASSLSFTPGDISQTSLNATLGLPDKQLALFEFLEGLVEEATETNSWPALYQTNNTGNFPTQRGMPSYRYSLAFTAYAIAAKTITHTPAHTGPTFALLSSIFKLMTRPEVHSYWSQKGDCAPFFLTAYCEQHNVSMCDLNTAWHGASASHCPDPVFFGNIMYSAHLAHVGALVKLFAPSPAAATLVLGEFSLGGTTYSYETLLDRLRYQAIDQKDTLGGGITCEPGNIYPSCQSHLHAALHLVDALDGHSDDAAIIDTWRTYLLTSNMAHIDNGPLGERLFEIAQQTPRHYHIPDFGIPIGCASHDVWVLAYMSPWASDVDSVLALGRELLKQHPGWVEGSLQDKRCKALAGEENWDVGSAMYTVLEAQVARGGDGDMERSGEAIGRFEKASVAAVEGDQYHYVSEYGLDVLVTTQLAMSMVIDETTLVSLHGLAGKEIIQGGGAYIKSISGDVWVRRAHRDGTFTLLGKGDRGDRGEVKITIEGVGVVEKVLANGEEVKGWEAGEGGVRIVFELEEGEDVSVVVVQSTR